MPLEKNQILPLTIHGVTGEGNGVGKTADGMVVFVPHTAVGDELLCRIVKVQKTHAFGRMEKLITPSPDRGEDPTDGCAVCNQCGGCVWRHVTYEAECAYKAQWVEDTLRRIGGVTVKPLPLICADNPDRYRNKAQFPVAKGDTAPVMGFFAPRSHRIIPQQDCRLQPPSFQTVLQTVSQWMQEQRVPAYDEETHTGLIRHIYIRRGAVTGQLMVCLVATRGKLWGISELIDALRRNVDSLVSLSVNINPDKTNVILGERTYVLWGKDAIEDELCGLTFRLSPHSFYQVNHAQTEKLYSLVGELAGLDGTQTVLDLYCGTGTIGLSMARKARQIIGVEVVPAAVEDAKENARQNGIDNARFLCADASSAAKQLAKEGIRPQVVVVDPPRKGCDEALIQTVVGMTPEKVVYVSCDPATLARDLKVFSALGYAPRTVQPVDLFPRTAHVETVVLMSRVNRQRIIKRPEITESPAIKVKEQKI